MPREPQRSRRRREARARLAGDSGAARRPLCAAEVAALFAAIDHGKQARY